MDIQLAVISGIFGAGLFITLRGFWSLIKAVIGRIR